MNLKRLKAIYQPRGPAREYAKLALNPYKGCTHRCIYCYNAKRFGANGAFFESAQPRAGIIEAVERDCQYLATALGDKCPEIQMTFLGDCYQPAELELKLTRQIIKIFIKHNLPFTILTKSPYILRDVDLFAGYPRFRAGFSFTTLDQAEADIWEPGTMSIQQRFEALHQFTLFDKPVWISLEPVMRIESTIGVIEELKTLPDFYWIGALNHHKPPSPINKFDAVKRIGAALTQFGCKFKFKKSLEYRLA